MKKKPTANLPQNPATDLPHLNEVASDKLYNFTSHQYWGVSDPARFKVLLEEAKGLVNKGHYLGDNLFTWGRNNSALEDDQFRDAWQKNIKNTADETIVWRRYVLACAAFHSLHFEGDFVECGVYLGSGIKTVIDYLGGPKFSKTFWGYDTFDYNPVPGHKFSEQQNGLYDSVKERFSEYKQVKLIQGLLPDSLKTESPEKICYLHIDLNNAEFEIAVLEALFDRVSAGGVIILDDYEWSAYRPQKIAESKWFDHRKYRVFPLPTGQGIVLKR